MPKVPGGWSTDRYSGFVSQLRNPKLKEHQSFIKDCKQTCPTFAPERYIIFFIWTVNKLTLCSGRRHSIFQVSSLYKHPCKTPLQNTPAKTIQNKGSQWLWSQGIYEPWKMVRGLSPNSSTMGESQNKYADWIKPDKKRTYTISLHLYKIIENAV